MNFVLNGTIAGLYCKNSRDAENISQQGIRVRWRTARFAIGKKGPPEGLVPAVELPGCRFAS
jgi:hypothetical protein